jgi:hypothetical protein
MPVDKEEEVSIPLTDAGEKREDALPEPATARPSTPSRPKLSAAMIIPIWMILSASVILYNNYLYNTLYFPYPVFTVTWHLIFAVCRLCLFVLLVLNLHVQGYWNPRIATDNQLIGWCEGCQHYQRCLPPLYPTYRPPVQWQPDLEQQGVPLSFRSIYSDAQGTFGSGLAGHC